MKKHLLIIVATLVVFSHGATAAEKFPTALVQRSFVKGIGIDRHDRNSLIRQTPEVMNGYYVTGDADFLLIVTAESMEDYEAFTRKFFYQNHDIKGFKTMVIMDRVKVGFFVPIDVDQF
jgi:DNA-binding Lrp family transcriptional regulator